MYVKWPHRLDLLVLSCAAVIPDLEIVTISPILGEGLHHGIMHSLLGIATVNLVLTILAARVIVPAVAVRLDRRFPGKGWRSFAGHDFVGDRKGWPATITSGLVGGLTHVLLDLPSHPNTEYEVTLLRPWEGVDLTISPWASAWWSTEIASVVTGILFAAMVFRWAGRQRTAASGNA
jgi:hypothetical protein